MRTIRQFFMPPPIDTSELSIHGIGIMETMNAGIVHRARGTGDYLLMAFSTPVTIRVNGKFHNYSGPMLMIWDPLHDHAYGNATRKWSHSWIHCDGSRLRRLLQDTQLPINHPLQLGDTTVVDRYLDEIYREITSYDAPNTEIVGNALHSWLLNIQRQIGAAPASSSVPASLLSVRQYIAEHFDERITLGALADRANLSASHFSTQFKKHFGISPIEQLIEFRMDAASRLLLEDDGTVAEVARKSGYEDPFHFSNQFKARFHVSPKEYRRLKTQA